MKLLTIILTSLLLWHALAQTCEVPSTITSSSTLNTIFTTAIDTIQIDNSLFGYLGEPTYDNLRSYVTTQGRFFIPLWVVAGLSMLFFTICAIQMCCFNCCRQQ